VQELAGQTLLFFFFFFLFFFFFFSFKYIMIFSAPRILAIAALASCVSGVTLSGGEEHFHASFSDGGALRVHPGAGDPATRLATAAFTDGLNVTGWGVLRVASSDAGGKASDGQQFFAAGAVEGYATAQQIAFQFENLYKSFFPSHPSPPVPVVVCETEGPA
jgi:hypothetical protein